MSSTDEFTDYVVIGRCRALPTFKGYTVDTRCREFRKINFGPMAGLEFIDFDSDRGDELLVELLEIVSVDSVLFEELFSAIVG